MTNETRTGSILLGWCLLAAAAEACTATSTVDKAKQNRDTDEYRAARDVAEEMVDEERWARDESTIEAGVGTLLEERRQGLVVPSDGRTTSGWNAVLDRPTARHVGTGAQESLPHGLTADGRLIDVGISEAKRGGSYGVACTVRDHMRLHVAEWDAFLRGATPIDHKSAVSQETMNWKYDSVYGESPTPTGAPREPEGPAKTSPPSAAPPADDGVDHAG